MQIELISSPAEFWDKIRNLIVQLELVPFKTYQQTDEVVLVSLEELDEELPWQWDLWLAQLAPDKAEKDHIPARDGWILVQGPRVDKVAKTLSASWISARADWLENGKILVNPELGDLFRKVRRIVIKDTKLGDVKAVFKEAGSSRVTKARYSQAAVLLQNEGWTITDKNNGPVLVLPKK